MADSFIQKFSLEGKVALVTGASYGIGFAIATAFAQAGATIVFNDIKQELVDKGLASYEEKGIKAHGYVCDVTNEAQVQEMVAKIEKEVGVIDILVNNAAWARFPPIWEAQARHWQLAFQMNVTAPQLLSQLVYPHMKAKGEGWILNITSATIMATSEPLIQPPTSGSAVMKAAPRGTWPGITAAAVPGRGEKGKTWAYVSGRSATNARVSANSAPLSPGKPMRMSAPRPMTGQTRRKAPKNSGRAAGS